MSAWQRIQNRVELPGRAFFRLLDNSARVQEQLLKDILSKNENSAIGKSRGFLGMRTIEDFQQHSPVICYEDVECLIDRIQMGNDTVLTEEAIVVFEETGGSSGGTKLIPLTASGLGAIQNAVIPWLHDLLTHRPGIASGSAYWSISPAIRTQQLIGDIPVGLPSDAAYFGSTLGEDIVETLAVPPEVGAIRNYNDWRHQTLSYLLARKDLSFISVWSPTFLLDLIKSIPHELDCIVNGCVDQGLVDLSRRRIQEIKHAVNGNNIDTQLLWPMLDTISCWLDASSARYREELGNMFPDVFLQGKGLLVTEGVVSLPVCSEDDAVLAINSCFFEFVDENDVIFLCHELVVGKTYRVLITTYSGLYRYDLGDQVLVSGFIGTTPLIKFCGRAGLVSDLCGEKLTEAFVLKQMSSLSGTAMLAPCANQKPGYVLFLDATDFDSSCIETVTRQTEQGLCANPQYAYAIRMNQLNRLCCYRVDDLWSRYIEYQTTSGKSLGDVKPPVLMVDSVLFKELFRSRIAA